MTRKTYFIFLSICLCLISVFFFLDNYIFSFLGIRNELIFNSRTILIIFIVCYESLVARNPYRIINLICIPLFFIGIAFKLMHWPFSLLLMMLSAITIFILLFINNSKNTKEKTAIFIILSIPAIHFTGMLIKIFHFPAAGLIFFLEFVLMLIVGIILAFRINKMV